MKTYPLEIENVGDDTYILMSRGHHDVEAFMRQVRDDGYDWPLGMPTHHWVKVVPCRCRQAHTNHYEFVEQSVRGAFPATFSHEAYGEHRYEAIVEAKAEAS